MQQEDHRGHRGLRRKCAKTKHAFASISAKHELDLHMLTALTHQGFDVMLTLFYVAGEGFPPLKLQHLADLAAHAQTVTGVERESTLAALRTLRALFEKHDITE